MYLKEELYKLIQTDESIFDFIQESSLDGLWYWDLENLENEWLSAKFWTVLGYNPDEMPHKSAAWQGIINEDDLKLASENFTKHCDNPNHPYDQIVRYKHKNGSTKWIRCRGLAIRDNTGKPIRMLGAHQDVTELKRSEQDLYEANEKARESEEKYRAFYDNAPLSYQSLDENGCFIDINPMWEKTLGYERSEVIGKWYGDFLHPDYVEHFRINFPAFKKRGYVSDVQFKLRRKDNTFIHVSFEGCVGYTPEGKFKQTYCVFKDITEQKAIENALIKAKEKAEESEENLSITLLSIGDGVITTNKFGIIDRMNKVALKLCGWHEDEIIGKPLTEVFNLIDAFTREPVHNPVEKVIESGKTVELANHTILVSKDGKEYHIADSAAPIKDKDGNIKGVVLVFSDVSDKFAAEEEIRFLAHITANSPVITAFHDKELNMVWANNAYQKATGLSLEEIKGKKCYQVWNLSKPCNGCPVIKALETGENAAHEITPDNQEHWPENQGYWLSQATPVRDAHGDIIGAIEFAVDITEHKQAELKLAESEEMMRNSQSVAHICSYSTNLIVDDIAKSAWSCSPEFYEIFGIDKTYPHTIEGWAAFIHPDFRDEMVAYHEFVIKGKIRFEHEYKIIRINDGAERWVYGTGKLEFDEKGNPIRMHGAIQDITERKLDEEELKRSEFLLKASLESQKNTILFSIDTEYRYLFFNKVHSDGVKYAYNKEIKIGTNSLEYITSDTVRNENKANFDLAFKGISNSHIQQYGDAHPEWFEAIYNPLYNDEQEIIGATCLGMNINERKQAEELVQKRNVELKSANIAALNLLEDLSNEIEIRKQREEALSIRDERLQKQNESLLALVSHITLFQTDLQQAIAKITETCHELAGAERVSVWLYNDDYSEFSCINLYDGTTRQHINNGDTLRCEDFPTYFASQKSGNVIDAVDVYTDPRTCELPAAYYKEHNIRSMLDTPVWFLNRLGAVLCFEHTGEQREWSSIDVRLATSMATLLSLCFQNEDHMQAEKNFRHSIDQSPLGIRVVNQKGEPVYVNQAFLKIYDFSSLDEYVNTPAIERYTNESYREHLERKKIRKEGKDVDDYEISIRRSNGDIRHVKIWRKEVIWNKEKHFQVINQDITENKTLFNELLFAKEKAEESDRLKSAFLANMSHEIRTPMNGILGFSELLKEPGLSGETQQEYIKIIEQSGARMLNTINDIIDISKIEAGLMKLDMKETNINEQIEFVYAFFKPEAENKGIKFSFSSTLPQKEATIKADSEKVYAILTNLVKNAFKYTEKGSIKLGCDLVKTDSNLSLQFFVKDTGIGIPKDRQEAIFERFIHADIADKMAYQGAGLGLAITKSYVEMLGGKIWVESEIGKGSAFYFTLPYNTNPVAETIDHQLATSEKNNDFEKLKILIAEDDVASEMLILAFIKSFGKEFLKARTGVEAVEVCRTNPDVDLILMDIRMPEMNGYEATKQIRTFNEEVVIIAQTAFGMEGDRQKSIDAGCNDYIAKPINKIKLQTLIQKYFKK